MSTEITKKTRVRAGHKVIVGRIIADIKTGSDERERNIPKLEQQRKKLREKYEIIRKLDCEIQGQLEAEDEVSNEIEQANIVSDEIELTLILLPKIPELQLRRTLNLLGRRRGISLLLMVLLLANPMTELVLHLHLHQSLTEFAPLTR